MDFELLGWEALAAAVLAGCAAVAWYVPFLRRYAVAVGLAVLAAMTFYRRGRKAGGKHVQDRWDEAERRTVEESRNARRTADRDAASGKLRDPRDRDDL